MKNMYFLIACLLLALQHVYPQGPQFAQNGITVAGGNGQGPEANQFNEPNNIVVDAAGNIYVADLNNNRIQKWAPGASAGVTVAGGNGQGSAANQFNHTTDIRFDAAGNMYIADYNNHRVQKWAPGASSGITVAGGNGMGSAPNQLNFPAGIFLDAFNNIYVADYFNHRIQKWGPGASAGVTVAGGNGEGPAPNQLFFPNDVYVDVAGNIIVPDQNNHRVQKWAPGASSGVTIAGGNGFGTAANQLYFPTGVNFDKAGNLFIADFINDRIQVWAPGATTGVTVAGGNGLGSAPNQFFHPLNIFFDADENMFISDVYNHRVQRFNTLRPCPADLVITVPNCAAKVAITWREPRDSFPDSIRIPLYLHPDEGFLTYMGAMNGHGYYKSARSSYLWPVARDISEFIGDTSVNGHLATITTPAESNFVTSLINGTELSPWIGLYSTGKPVTFRWVTGEAFSYSNWAAGEPNNFMGNGANLAEPYVHLYDIGIWNDQRSILMPFITEFERPLIRFRQISGVSRGSQQGVGVYTICYERTNYITSVKDTCCFRITIKCDPVPLSQPAVTTSTVSRNGSAQDANAMSFHATAFPNPTNSQFTLNMSSGSKERISLQVLDITGKVVETRTGLAPNQSIRLGSNLRAGVYFVELKQGSKKVQMKVVKQTR